MEIPKRVLVMGATTHPHRYAYLATQSLLRHGHQVELYGRRKGEVNGIPIRNHTDGIEDIDTVTLYLNPMNQQPYYDFIMDLKPKRIIYNPGTENPELMKMAAEQGIENEVACTLVMLSIGNF